MLVLEVEDVDGASCAVDDMKKVEVLTISCVRSRVGAEGMDFNGGEKGEEGFRVRSDGRATECRWRRRKAVKTPVPHEADSRLARVIQFFFF
jgi:hypothetical protein